MKRRLALWLGGKFRSWATWLDFHTAQPYDPDPQAVAG